jgi:hypothetical protein
VIVKVGETATRNVSELLTAVASLKPGEAAKFDVRRGDSEVVLDITRAPARSQHLQQQSRPGVDGRANQPTSQRQSLAFSCCGRLQAAARHHRIIRNTAQRLQVKR